MADLPALAAHLAALLREQGLPVGPHRTARLAQAITLAHPQTPTQLRACALATLITDPADIPTLDQILALVFGGYTDPATHRGDPHQPPPPPATNPTTATGRNTPGAITTTATATATTANRATHRDATTATSPTPAIAVATQRLASRDFAALDPTELAQLATAMRHLRLATPSRPTRRPTPAGTRGTRVDLRATLRAARRSGGHPVRLHTHRPRHRPRRLVVLLDISASMAPYARALLQLLYAATNATRAEVFTFATQLTHLTRALHRLPPAQALHRAGHTAPDWSGGTRIGEALKTFLDRHGNRGMARGAVILIVCDGWETGDADILATQMARLSRLAYRIVWANPRTQNPRYQPLVAGMAAAWPHCDAVVSAHSLHALHALLTALADPHRTRAPGQAVTAASRPAPPGSIRPPPAPAAHRP